jgi:hypothetical protein
VNPFNASLTLETLDAREVPAVLGLTKITPVPIPPSVVETALPKAGMLLPALKPLAVSPPADHGGKAGILFPVFKPAVSQPAAPNGILFPVFVGK